MSRIRIPSALNSFVKKRTIVDGMSVLFEHGLFSVAAFITSVLLARSVDKAPFGLYVLILSVIWIAQSAHRGLVSVPYTVLLPKKDSASKADFLGDSVVYTLVYIVLVSATLVICYSVDLFGIRSGPAASLLIPGVLVFTFVVFREHLRSAMFATLRVTGALIPSIIASLLQILAVALLFTNGELDTTDALSIVAGAGALATTLMLVENRHDMGFDIRRMLPRYRNLWSTGKWNLMNVFWSAGASHLYPWLIALLVGTEAVAVYGVSFTLSTLLGPVARGANAYILPRLSHSLDSGGRNALKRMVRKAIVVLTIPFGAWLLLGLFAGGEILSLLYSNEYAGYGTLVFLLIAKSVLEGVSIPAIAALQALQMPNVITQSFAIGTVFTFTAGILLIRQYDLVGAAIAALCSTSLAVGYRWIMLKKLLKTR